ncbi:hypothetical protein ACA910_020371 [Epithemia clementina (nom. ined.)]
MQPIRPPDHEATNIPILPTNEQNISYTESKRTPVALVCSPCNTVSKLPSLLDVATEQKLEKMDSDRKPSTIEKHISEDHFHVVEEDSRPTKQRRIEEIEERHGKPIVPVACAITNKNLVIENIHQPVICSLQAQGSPSLGKMYIDYLAMDDMCTENRSPLKVGSPLYTQEQRTKEQDTSNTTEIVSNKNTLFGKTNNEELMAMIPIQKEKNGDHSRNSRY